MANENAYSRAIIDFQSARRKADLQTLLSLLTGKSNALLSYEEVRQKLHAIEGSRRELRDIPLDDIVGSVGRYADFNRDFLPRKESDKERWARVMAEATSLMGLPPIEVYQIGEVYFVLDGNHRVSVARQLDAKYIQAYVTEVKTKISITTDLEPDDLIIKAEYVDFLEKTQLNLLRPESDLTLTVPGNYPILLEHIAMHQYFMGLDKKRPVSYEEAVAHWYDTVYLPVIDVIKERGILHFFPERTEADLYIWIARHRQDLIDELGWQVEIEAVADDLIAARVSSLPQTISRVTGRILEAVTPEGLESGPPPGHWREEHLPKNGGDQLFDNILVGISKDDTEWQALDQALLIAKKEGAGLRGLHVVPAPDMVDDPATAAIVDEFQKRCRAAGIRGEIAVEVGAAARQICERAQWADLVIGKLTHPPANQTLARLSSGFRIMVRRCSRPILAVPRQATPIQKALLAYNGSPKADEALFIATYMVNKWHLPLVVLTIDNEDIEAESTLERAGIYLESADAPVDFLIKKGKVVKTVLKTASEHQCDLILIGGYKASPVVEIVKGSFVDEILRKAEIPTLICR
jgi:nucleotide-binding universal stress UspA family protein